MSKISVVVAILFLIFISLFSCTKRSTKPRPQELKLYLSLDLYGGGVIDGTQYISVSYENEVVKYSEKDFIEKGYVIVPKGKDVTIKISPANNGADYIFMGISGDASENLYESGEEYNFKMDSNKFFEITIKKKDDGEIKVYEFKFESGDNGYVEISRSKDETFSDTTKIEKGDGVVSIKMTELMLKKYTLRAKAVPASDEYIFSEWSIDPLITPSIITEDITIDDTMDEHKFKANFKVEENISINFEVVKGGNVTVITTKENVLANIQEIKGGKSDPIKIGESKFGQGYEITAVATSLANYEFLNWTTEYAMTSSITENKFIIKKDMNGKTFKADFGSTITYPVTFEPTVGGRIEVSAVKKSTDTAIADETIYSTTIYSTGKDEDKTINMPDKWFGAGYAVEAKAIPDKDYLFSDWTSAGTPVADTVGTITLDSDSKDKTYKASFEEEGHVFKFTAGVGGKIIITTTENESGNILDTKEIKAGVTDTIEITKSQFSANTYTVSVEAETGYEFSKWTPARDTHTFDLSYDMENKEFEAEFVEKEITITFNAGANGSISVVKKDSGGSETEIGKTPVGGGSVPITIKEIEFSTYTFEAKPVVADTDYKFNEWSGGATGNVNPLVITKDMNGKTITATFVKMITFTFTAGGGGAIDVYVFNGSTELSNKRVSENIKKGTIELAEYLLTAPYRVEARAIAINSLYEIDKWNNVASETAPIKQLDTAKTTHTVTFKAVTINYDYGTASSSLSSQTIDGDTWYQIKTPADLLLVANEIEKGTLGSPSPYASYKYIIMNHIDYGGGYHKPIGFAISGKQFTGVINGNGMTIKNAKYGKTTDDATQTYTGFVGRIEGGTISNLTIDSTVVINSTALHTGGIAGYAIGGATISDCVNKANISSYSIQTGYYISTGGIVGIIAGSGATALNVYNTGNIEGYAPTAATGGVSGFIGQYGKVENAYNTGKIEVSSTAKVYIGGVSGAVNDSGKIVNAYNTGEIVYSKNATSLFLGGIFGGTGSGNAIINNVYSTGTISSSASATHYIGGIAGNLGTATLANMYFVNANALPTHGFYSLYSGTYTADKTVANAGVSGTASWTDVLTAFNNASPSVWKKATDGRPVINGLGEGK